MEFENYNNDFIILKTNTSIPLPQIGRAIFDHKYMFIDEVIATEEEILLKLNQHYHIGDEEIFNEIKLSDTAVTKTINLPIYFEEGLDWEYVCSYTKLSQQEYIDQLTSSKLIVSMYGFMPGFIYLKGLPTHLQVPRKGTPTVRIPKNTLALGGPYVGIYSLPTPGGWHAIGEIAISITNNKTLPPIILNIGDIISLIHIDKEELKTIKKKETTIEDYNGLS